MGNICDNCQNSSNSQSLPEDFEEKQLFGNLSLKVNFAKIQREHIDSKLQDYFDDPQKFGKTFQIYLKVHSGSQQLKSKTGGILVSQESYEQILTNGMVLLQKEQVCQSDKYYLGFQIRTFKQENMIGMAQGTCPPFEIEVKPRSIVCQSSNPQTIVIKVKIKSRRNPNYIKQIGMSTLNVGDLIQSTDKSNDHQIINNNGEVIGTMDISSNFFENNSDEEQTQKEDSLIHLEIQHAKKLAMIVQNQMDTSLIDDQKLLRKQNWVNDTNNSFCHLSANEYEAVDEKRNRSQIITKKKFFESVPAIARVQFTRPPVRGPITANNSVAFAPISIIQEEVSNESQADYFIDNHPAERVFDTQDTKISNE